MNNRSPKGCGRSRLAPPALRQDAQAKQWRSQQAKRTSTTSQLLTPVQPVERPTERPMVPVAQQPSAEQQAAQRLAAQQQNAAATKIQQAFKNFQSRRALKAARADLQASIKGDMPERLAKLVGQSYVDAGLLAPTKAPISKASGRLAGDWSGGVATQKDTLNKLGHLDPIGTTHHTVSDHFLGFVNAGVKRLESSGQATDQQAAKGFRAQVEKDTLLAGPNPNPEKALFQLRQNLTYGPQTDNIKGDPGIGFDANFAASGKGGLTRDWDKRSTNVRPVHNIGLLLKSGHFELTAGGADHLTQTLGKARGTHDTMMQGQTYQTTEQRMQKVPNPAWSAAKPKPGVKKEITQQVTHTTTHQQTIPVHGVASGHFDAVTLTRKDKSTVPGFSKKTWK